MVTGKLHDFVHSCGGMELFNRMEDPENKFADLERRLASLESRLKNM
jgi:hypothetical protein